MKSTSIHVHVHVILYIDMGRLLGAGDEDCQLLYMNAKKTQ